MSKKINRKRKKRLKIWGETLFKLATITVAIVSVFVIAKTNKITNTANLLQIVDAIQQRTDIVFTAERIRQNYRFYHPVTA